jgi:hypothetical protein
VKAAASSFRDALEEAEPGPDRQNSIVHRISRVFSKKNHDEKNHNGYTNFK